MILSKDHPKVVELVEKGVSPEDVAQISKEIRSGATTIVAFVEGLGPVLTSQSNGTRANATDLLAAIVDSLNDNLSTEELQVLSVFFIDRLSEYHSVIPSVVRGILALIQCKNLPEGVTAKMFSKFFQSVSCQSLVREDRDTVFQIFQKATEKRADELRVMGQEWVAGVCNSIEGERDPRNLVFLFKFMPQFIEAFPLGDYVEEMFNVFACYYPIDFNPAPNVPLSITRELLAELLSNCLTATNDFCDSCFEILLEKLTSDYNVAKKDSLMLLEKCGEKFQSSSVEKHFETVWTSLKEELFVPNRDEEVLPLSLRALGSLCRHVESKETAEKYASAIFRSVSQALVDSSLNDFDIASRIIVTCAESSALLCSGVYDRIVPTFISQLGSSECVNSQQKTKVLKVVKSLVVASKRHQVLSAASIEVIQRVLYEIVQKETNLPLFRVALETFTVTPEFVCFENRVVLYAKLVTLFDSPSDEVSQTVADAVMAFAQVHPEEIRLQILDKVSVTRSSAPILLPLIRLESFFGPVSDAILARLFDQSCEEAEKIKICQLVVRTLDESPQSIAEKWYSGGVVDKLRVFMKEHPDSSSDLFFSISLVITSVVKHLDATQQEEMVTKFLPAMNLQHINDLYFTAGILGFLDKGVVFKEDHFEVLVTEISQLSATHEDENIRRICNHLLCSLFNKIPTDSKHKGVLAKVLGFLKDEVKKHNKQAVHALAWVSKALLMSGFSDISEIIQTLCDLLDHPTLSETAELAFEVISLEMPQLHLPVIKHLFQQKLFVLVFRNLERKVEEYSSSHLAAVAFVLKATPHKVLKMEIAKVGPILLRSLELDQERPLTYTLGTIKRFLAEKNEFFGRQLQSLVVSLLRLAQFKANMKTRIAALECLELVSEYPTFVTLPHKTDVLFGLVPVLGDKKRLVRNAAVQTRLKWFMVGEESEGK